MKIETRFNQTAIKDEINVEMMRYMFYNALTKLY